MLPLREYSKRGAYDEIWTPMEALDPLLLYLSESILDTSIVWDMCPGEGHLIRHLQMAGYFATSIDEDSLKNELITYNIIVTNPPYSNKHKWLERAVSLGKPFALLMPVTALGTKRIQKNMEHVDMLFLNKRVDFTGKKRPWFAVAWYTRGILNDRMVFEEE